MKLAFTIMAALACLADDRTCYAADRLVGDVYTYHSSHCQDAYAKVCEPWGQPHRLSWQHDVSSDWSTDIGIGTNSYGKLSANAGMIYQPIQIGPVRAGVFASLVSGYNRRQLRTCVVAGGFLSTIEVERVVFQVMYVPAIGRGTVSVTQLRAGLTF